MSQETPIDKRIKYYTDIFFGLLVFHVCLVLFYMYGNYDGSVVLKCAHNAT